MSGARRFWRETIGVTPGAQQPGSSKRAPASRARPQSPADDTGFAGTRPRVVDSSLEHILDGLPVGSLMLGDEVANSLWREPTPEDLACLATIAGQRRRLSSPALRDAVSCAVTIRLRFERLCRTRAPMQLDPLDLSERSAEFERLAHTAEEVHRMLHRGEAAPAEVPEVLAAARQLMPEPQVLMALAAHSAELGAIAELARQGRTSECWRPIPEATGLLTAVQVGRVSRDLYVCLEIYAACLMALRDMETRAQSDLIGARGLLDHIARATGQPVVAPESGGTLASRGVLQQAAWRRLLQDARSRIDERLTRPARARTPLSQEPARHNSHSLATGESGDTSPADDSLLAHMRAVRLRCTARRRPVVTERAQRDAAATRPAGPRTAGRPTDTPYIR